MAFFTERTVMIFTTYTSSSSIVIVDCLTDRIEFYAISPIFKPCNGGVIVESLSLHRCSCLAMIDFYFKRKYMENIFSVPRSYPYQKNHPIVIQHF